MIKLPDTTSKSAKSAENDFWTLRPPADIRRLMSRVIRDRGGDKADWTFACIREGLAKYKGKKDA